MSTTDPVFVIGVGRSGTNLVSAALAQDSRFWNAYENRYIWSYRQSSLSHDRRRPEDADDRTKRYIRNFFHRLADRHGKTVIDKTPSNTLRVGFVHEVFPEARIVHLIRDGRDNALSRLYEWYGGRRVLRSTDSESLGVSSRSALFCQRLGHLGRLIQRGNLPLERWPVFLWDNLGIFLANMITGQPVRYAERFPGMRDFLDAYGVLVTAAVQWREGVMHAVNEGRRLPDGIYLEVRYEDLLANGEQQWNRISKFLEVGIDNHCLEYVKATVRPDNSNKWRREATKDALETLEPHIRATLEFLGYEWAEPHGSDL